MLLRFLLCAGVALTMVGAAAAGVPQLVNYQGILLDMVGDPVTVPTTVVFAIWDDPAAGDMLWSEEQIITPDNDGCFNVLLGLVLPIPDSAFAGAETYLSMQLDTYPEMSPRTRIVSVAYAHRVATVDGAGGGVVSGDISVSDGDIHLEQSAAGTGSILKDGSPFIHNFGTANTFIGSDAGNFTMSGGYNTASGSGAFAVNTTGAFNTVCGVVALASNQIGNHNTANGYSALYYNTHGSSNTACGFAALFMNNAGNGNVAVGDLALNSNTFGNYNTACGTGALSSNDSGYFNTAMGDSALYNNTTGHRNTASGTYALHDNTTGEFNTACGFAALRHNNTGIGNTAIGYGAGVASSNLTNATAIGLAARVDASNKIRLGDDDVSVIEGQVPFTWTSDKNEKENFLPVDGDEVLRKISGLDLTSWNYIGHDPQKFRHYGPVAQEFFAAFGNDDVGTIGTPTTINSGDMAGILMIAVQTLEKRTAEVEDLRAQIDELRTLVDQLVEQNR